MRHRVPARRGVFSGIRRIRMSTLLRSRFKVTSKNLATMRRSAPLASLAPRRVTLRQSGYSAPEASHSDHFERPLDPGFSRKPFLFGLSDCPGNKRLNPSVEPPSDQLPRQLPELWISSAWRSEFDLGFHTPIRH